MSSFYDELSTVTADNVKKPEQLPPGFYLLTVTEAKLINVDDQGAPLENKNVGWEYTFRVLRPLNESTVEALRAANIENLDKRELRHSFWITPDALYRHKDFCRLCGVDTTGRPYRELFRAPVGHMVSAELHKEVGRKNNKTQTDEEGQPIYYTRVKSFAPAA